MTTVQISVVIPTHNRARYLSLTIQSLLDQGLPRSDFEIIVVDNRSTDSTKQVIDGFGGGDLVRYVFEPALGASRARNTGWGHARGRYVAFLDDDVIASPAWLENILGAFETLQPTPGCVGGRVDPIWEALLIPERERVLRLLVDRIDYDGGAGEMAIQWRLSGFGQLAGEIGA